VVSVWSIFRRDLDQKKPSANIDVGNCVTSLAFHPSKPSILAGGTFSGEIFLWDIFKGDPLLCSSRIDEYYHREAVTEMQWVVNQGLGGHQD